MHVAYAPLIRRFPIKRSKDASGAIFFPHRFDLLFRCHEGKCLDAGVPGVGPHKPTILKHSHAMHVGSRSKRLHETYSCYSRQRMGTGNPQSGTET